MALHPLAKAKYREGKGSKKNQKQIWPTLKSSYSRLSLLQTVKNKQEL